jgi:hypothetical protein
MPLTQNPIVDWPPALNHLLETAQIASGQESKRYCRIDVDVDRETLFLLNEFEGHVRHRKVRLRPVGSFRSVVGEMNPLIGLGAAFDPARHIGKVRISFHDLQDEDHADET